MLTIKNEETLDIEQALDTELRRLKNCLAIIQDDGYLKKAKNEETGFAKMHIEFIKNNVHKYPERGERAFKKEFTKTRELFKTLSSFFINLNCIYFFPHSLFPQKLFSSFPKLINPLQIGHFSPVGLFHIAYLQDGY